MDIDRVVWNPSDMRALGLLALVFIGGVLVGRVLRTTVDRG